MTTAMVVKEKPIEKMGVSYLVAWGGFEAPTQGFLNLRRGKL
jgi:hypothetical protein